MIKHLQKIGNSKGIILDKAILNLLGIDGDSLFEIKAQDGGLFIKPLDAKQVYKNVANKHRKSLNKLSE